MIEPTEEQVAAFKDAWEAEQIQQLGRPRKPGEKTRAGLRAALSLPTKTREGDQVLPTGQGACVQDRIIAAMEESKRVGQERYGSVLRTFNGRRSIRDAAEEARDLYVYLTQIEMEREAGHDQLIEVVCEVLEESIPGLARIASRAIAEAVVVRLESAVAP